MEKIAQTLKEALKLLWQDLYAIRYVAAAIVSYWVIVRLLFHHFCPMVIVTGFPCPGCGMTRAALHLLMLQLDEAWQYNPAVYAWACWGVWAVWQRYIRQEKKRKQTGFLIVVLTITIVCYLWRMAVVFPAKEPPMRYSGDNLLARWLPFYPDFARKVMSILQ